MIDQILVFFLSLIAAALTIRHYTKDLDDDLNPETRELLAIRLLCLEDGMHSDSFLHWVSRAFDRVFGEKHLSLRCFGISSLVSASVFTVLFLYTVTTAGDFNVSATIISGSPILVLLAGILLNVPSDYVALLETRWIIRRRIPTHWKVILDLILTYVISLGWIALLMATFVAPQLSLMTYWAVVINPIELGGAINYDGANKNAKELFALAFLDVLVLYIFTLRLVLTTSYVTSLWVWLYGLSDLTIRLLARSSSAIKHLDVEGKPARAIGLVMTVLLLFFGTVGYVMFWALS